MALWSSIVIYIYIIFLKPIRFHRHIVNGKGLATTTVNGIQYEKMAKPSWLSRYSHMTMCRTLSSYSATTNSIFLTPNEEWFHDER